MAISLSVCIDSVPAGRIFVKIYIGGSYSNLSRKFKFGQHSFDSVQTTAYDNMIWPSVLAIVRPTTYSFIRSFIHSVVCLTTGQYPFPKRVLYRVRSGSYSFIFQCLLVPLRSLNSCLRLLPRLPATSVLPSIFPSIKCFRRQLLRKMQAIRLMLLVSLNVGYSFPHWLCVIILLSSHDRSNWSSPSFSST